MRQATVVLVLGLGCLSSPAATQESGHPELNAIVDAVVTRPARGRDAAQARADNEALLARLAALPAARLTFDERNNPYYGNFSGATARPPAADGTLRGEWHINPFDPSWDEAQARLPRGARLGRDLRDRAARDLRRPSRADPPSDAPSAPAPAAAGHVDVF